jgi:hypothetical protein
MPLVRIWYESVWSKSLKMLNFPPGERRRGAPTPGGACRTTRVGRKWTHQSQPHVESAGMLTRLPLDNGERLEEHGFLAHAVTRVISIPVLHTSLFQCRMMKMMRMMLLLILSLQACATVLAGQRLHRSTSALTLA